jgi:hypothetical protein
MNEANTIAQEHTARFTTADDLFNALEKNSRQ